MVRSVLARRAGLGGLVVGRHQRPRGLGAERLPPQLRDPLGVRVAQRGGLRGVLGQRLDDRARLPRGPAQDGVDEAGAAARLGLGELDGLPHRRVGGHAIEVGELERAEPQRGHHGGLEAVDRAVRERLDDVVERGAALDGAVRELGRETRGREGRAGAAQPPRGGRDRPTRIPRKPAAGRRKRRGGQARSSNGRPGSCGGVKAGSPHADKVGNGAAHWQVEGSLFSRARHLCAAIRPAIRRNDLGGHDRHRPDDRRPPRPAAGLE